MILKGRTTIGIITSTVKEREREEALRAELEERLNTYTDTKLGQLKTWELELATEGMHGIIFELDENTRRMEIYCKLFRYGNDVTDLMSKSTIQLYRFERISELGFDDNGTYDNVWNEANKNKMKVLITDDMIAGKAHIKVIYDDDVLEREYTKIKA